MFRHPHLDAHIGAVQPLEGLFVGDVVAEEHRGGRTLLMAQDVEGLALIRGDDGELENLLALGDLRAPAVCDGECLSQGGVGVLLGCVAHVERDTGRFQFDGHPGIFGGDGRQLGGDGLQQRLGVAVDGVHEAGVELRAVTADQMHLGRQSRQGRQIAQRTSGDQRGGRRR